MELAYRHEISDVTNDVMEEDPLASSSSKPGQADFAPISPFFAPNSKVFPMIYMSTELKGSKANNKPDPSKPVFVDVDSILSGKKSSMVTIAPARPQISNPVDSKVKQLQIPEVNLSSGTTSKSSSACGYIKKIDSPNVKGPVEIYTPSLIFPLIYENAPKETFEEFKKSVYELMEENKYNGINKNGINMASERDEEEIKIVPNYYYYDFEKWDKEVEQVKHSSNGKYFESTLGKFLLDLGMSLVREHVKADLQQEVGSESKTMKGTSLTMSAVKNRCRHCNFKTESEICMEHHLASPHMKRKLYLCNFCKYKTKVAQDIVTHMKQQHGVVARLEEPLARHQCHECSYETSRKQLLVKHLKRCRPHARSNQAVHLDWEPPAKTQRIVMPKENKNPIENMVRSCSTNHRLQTGISFKVSQKKGKIAVTKSPHTKGRNPMLVPATQYVTTKDQGSIHLESKLSLSVEKSSNAFYNRGAVDPLKSKFPIQNYVVCEICDKASNNLIQLQNHFFVAHAHMLRKRPSLKCQKCQVRCFTNQGMERHLLGFHGLVSESLLMLEKNGKDGGWCPICSKYHTSRLLNHIQKIHHKNLQLVLLSYKCTVCCACFDLYKDFEYHLRRCGDVLSGSRQQT